MTASDRRMQAQPSLTGCGVGYACGANGTCVAADASRDPLVARLPRYRLGRQAMGVGPPKLYGFPVGRKRSPDDDHKLAYYSTHGDLLDEEKEEGSEEDGEKKPEGGAKDGGGKVPLNTKGGTKGGERGGGNKQ